MTDGYWSHYTGEGLFEIKHKFLAGMDFYELYFRSKLAGTYTHPYLASVAIDEGKLDEELGFPVSSLNVPFDWRDWNMFK